MNSSQSIDLTYFKNFSNIIGCDEVGRGPIAGPVNGASVIVNKLHISLLTYLEELGVTDSKKLTTKKRKKILELLRIDINKININTMYEVETEFGEFKYMVCECSPQEIDEINILQASLKCMQLASNFLMQEEAIVLVDGNHVFNTTASKIEAITKGDSKSTIIALASIIAKEYRDEKMLQFAELYPGYLLEKNAGYPTKAHKAAVAKLGITPIHRKSFKGVKEFVK